MCTYKRFVFRVGRIYNHQRVAVAVGGHHLESKVGRRIVQPIDDGRFHVVMIPLVDERRTDHDLSRWSIHDAITQSLAAIQQDHRRLVVESCVGVSPDVDAKRGFDDILPTEIGLETEHEGVAGVARLGHDTCIALNYVF